MKLTLITGASKGIGKATAKLFSEKEGKVMNLSRTACSLVGVADVKLDLTNEDAVQNIEAFAAKIKTQEIHLIHNAAVLLNDNIETLDSEQFSRVLALNVVAPQILNRFLVPKMTPGSSIIYIGSTLSEKAVKNSFSYVSSKHTVIGMMRATCQDLAGSGIHTACICPGFTDTEMLREHVGGSREALEAVGNLSAYGRLIEPVEIASTIKFACENPVVNGTIIHANLGQIES
tara:strand:+ start:363 stop:1058 length:696 start_codon:yes stop_codon:yes gene_type:complete